MARWRAVPTTVWTAVGALAFLASTGLAVVLGAGLHVWSGPLTPPALPGAAAPVGSSAGRGGGSGVVTVSPPRTPHPASPRTTSPPAPTAAALPFIPFTLAPAPAPATTTVAAQGLTPTLGHGNDQSGARPRPQLMRLLVRLPLDLRTGLFGMGLRTSASPTDGNHVVLTARPQHQVHTHGALRANGRAHDDKARHHGHAGSVHGRHGHGHGKSAHSHRHGDRAHHDAQQAQHHHNGQD